MRSLVGILLLTFYFNTVITAQTPVDYVPSAVFTPDSSALRVEIEARTLLDVLTAPPEHREFFEWRLEGRKDEIVTQLADSSFIFNGALDSFVTGIFQDIVTANKLPVRPLVFVSRLPRENAYSMGSGLFTVDIGLLASTKTVEELAFIFSHELAHDQLGHQRETLIELSSGAEDRDEAYRRLRRRSTGSRKRDKLIDGLREQAYGLSRSSRMAELAADSLGLVYLSKTDYYSGIAAEALENIRQEEIDRDDVVGSEIALDSALQTVAYPFKERWIEAPTRMLFDVQETADEDGRWNRDSLSSHPELSARIAAIGAMQRAVLGEVDSTARVTKTNPFRSLSDYETVPFYLDSELPAHMIGKSLFLLRHQPDDTYLYASIGRGLLMTHRLVQERRFSESVPPSTYFDDPMLQKLVLLLQQIRQSELSKLTLAYLREHQAAYPESPALRAALEEAEAYFTE